MNKEVLISILLDNVLFPIIRQPIYLCKLKPQKFLYKYWF